MSISLTDLGAPKAPPSKAPLSRAARREALFQESRIDAALRCLIGTARAAMPNRIGALPALAADWMRPHGTLPDPLAAPLRYDGVCGIAHDLSVETLLAAHAQGLHPGGIVGPVKWWSPPERCILFFENFHMSRRIRGMLRQQRHRVTFDRDFEGVMKACAARRPGKLPVTWITPAIMHAYAALHDAGHAHSFEVWDQDGELAGGGYGVAIGGVFIVESQFARQPNASKIGFGVLNWHLAHWGFWVCDNKGPARHVLDMGFHVVPRAEYHRLLPHALRAPGGPARWQVTADLKTVADWWPRAPQRPLSQAA